jgi:hypothetical protein
LEFDINREQFLVNEELVRICQEVTKDEKANRDWDGTESDDECQTGDTLWRI